MSHDERLGGYTPTDVKKVDRESPEEAVIGMLKQKPVLALRFVLGLERVPEVQVFKQKDGNTVAVKKQVDERSIAIFMAEYVEARLRYDMDLALELQKIVEEHGMRALRGTSSVRYVEDLLTDAKFTVQISRTIIDTVVKFENSPDFLERLGRVGNSRMPQIFVYLNTHGYLPFKNEKKRAAAVELFIHRLPA